MKKFVSILIILMVISGLTYQQKEIVQVKNELILTSNLKQKVMYKDKIIYKEKVIYKKDPKSEKQLNELHNELYKTLGYKEFPQSYWNGVIETKKDIIDLDIENLKQYNINLKLN